VVQPQVCGIRGEAGGLCSSGGCVLFGLLLCHLLDEEEGPHAGEHWGDDDHFTTPLPIFTMGAGRCLSCANGVNFGCDVVAILGVMWSDDGP